MTEQQWAFAFVDLAGFTALTEAHGDETAAAQVARFCELADATLEGPTRVVKSIGDAVMLASEEGSSLVTSAHRLMSICLEEPDFPVPRAGASVGTATRTGDDFIGMAVNIAARIAARAAGGQLLVTAGLADHARALGHEVLAVGPMRLRNVREPVEVFTLDLMPAAGAVIDPICRMRVLTATAAGHLRYEDVSYWFCSLACAQAFAADPVGALDGAGHEG